jgi:hypothetical protein
MRKPHYSPSNIHSFDGWIEIGCAETYWLVSSVLYRLAYWPEDEAAENSDDFYQVWGEGDDPQLYYEYHEGRCLHLVPSSEGKP